MRPRIFTQAWHFFNAAKELALVEDGKVLQPPTLLDVAAQATQSIRFQLKLKEMSRATRAIRRCSHRTVCASILRNPWPTVR
jgi:hypothetical protein